jgi:transcription-repair coupling factor (superfamily II helicase)
VNLRVDLKIDESYIPDMNQRLMVYRRIASARSEDELERAVAEVRDRYGPPPESILNLADYGRIRVMADQLGLETVDREGDRVVFRFGTKTPLDPARLVTFLERRKDVTLVPPAGMRLELKQGQTGRAGQAGQSGQPGQSGQTGPTGRTGQSGLPGRGGLGAPPARPRRPLNPVAPASWWTARATAGEVTAGFTKAEILKPQAEDPRGPSGVFTRVGGLLSELLA